MNTELTEERTNDNIRLAFKYLEAAEAEKLLKSETDAEVPTAEELFAAFSEFEKKLSAAAAEEKRQKRETLRRRLLRFSAAAAAVLVLSFTFSIGLARYNYTHGTVNGLSISIEDGYTQLNVTSSTFDIPADWKGRCYPSYIPSSLSPQENLVNPYVVEYYGDDSSMLRFLEYNSESSLMIDNRNVSFSYTEINGRDALIADGTGFITIAWGIDDRLYMIETTLPKSEALKIAKGICKVK